MASRKLIYFILGILLPIILPTQLYADEQSPVPALDYSVFQPSAAPVVSASDLPTTNPTPLNLQGYEDLEELMIHLEELHKRAGDRNPAIAERAADEMPPLIRASMHERLAPEESHDDSRYQTLAKSFYQANNNLREAIKSRQRRAIDRAYQAQSRSCTACHEIFRPKDKKDTQP